MPTDQPKPRIAIPHESVMDMRQARAELERAENEIAAVDRLNESNKQRRSAMLIEPLSRLALVQRYIAQTLKRHGWES